jgi:hypothetical protein
MSRVLLSFKRQALQRGRDGLIEEFGAANAQLISALGDMVCVRVERGIE